MESSYTSNYARSQPASQAGRGGKMETCGESVSSLCSSNGGSRMEEEKPKVIVIMGPTGSGKSKLAIDLAAHFPIEIINADSMQVYQGLDVLTNKVPLLEQKGVPHHLLGILRTNDEFTAKKFRDAAVPIINDIVSRNRLPVIVGGTNYYIQALVSPFLRDDSGEEMDETDSGDEHADDGLDMDRDSGCYSYDLLKEVDPRAANRIHPNNLRKIKQYLSLYFRSGVCPSKLHQGSAVQNWGRVENSRYKCCFICIDAATSVLDGYVNDRVECMIGSGLLDEVYDIYSPNADYTQGLRQAIGVREFKNFLQVYGPLIKENISAVRNSPYNEGHRVLLEEAIDQVKLNTRKLVRCQKRRVNRLQTLFGWRIHYLDATESISGKSEECWAAQVVSSAANIIRSFLDGEEIVVSNPEKMNKSVTDPGQRDLWTQYICKECGDKVLRGAHEWEQHKQGRGHRKRVSSMRKHQNLCLIKQQ